MSLRINIEIAIADDQAYTNREAAIIAAMQAHPSNGAAAQEAAITKVVEAVKAAQPAPAKAAAPASRPVGRPRKEAPAPSSPASTTPAVLDTTLDEEVLEEEAEELEDDLLGGEEEATTEFTKDDAIAKATQLVSAQKQSVVKAALVKAGAKRVSDLNDSDSIQVFMAALEA